MSYDVKILGHYLVEKARDEKDAKEQALHHFHAGLNRWTRRMASANHMFYIEIKKVKTK